MTPGCYPDISLAAYHAAPGLSKSDLDLIARSPAHWKYGPREETAAMRLGAAVHAAVLEPEQWERRYAGATNRRRPDPDANADAVTLTAAEWETCQRIRDAVWNHPTCRDLFSAGYAEQSAWWFDPETGLLCKCRPDWSRPGLLLDLKTATDASPAGFARAVERYRYHVQAAYALDGWPQAGGNAADQFLFIVVEKAPPYAIGLYELSSTLLDTARTRYRHDLATAAD
ncbi:MAG TPA: PD-(D/E)XK nuclease-like domain-containing protein, partial [Candidatus Competibacteraceae bacterium]|nr:PD-(D/E)XK nuclease-like domain-containing protein [Candidatus Competibacteraceae bacterium]